MDFDRRRVERHGKQRREGGERGGDSDSKGIQLSPDLAETLALSLKASSSTDSGTCSQSESLGAYYTIDSAGPSFSWGIDWIHLQHHKQITPWSHSRSIAWSPSRATQDPFGSLSYTQFQPTRSWVRFIPRSLMRSKQQARFP